MVLGKSGIRIRSLGNLLKDVNGGVFHNLSFLTLAYFYFNIYVGLLDI